MRALISTLVLLLASTCAFATPPKLTIPDTIKPIDGYIALVPDTDAVSIIYISLDGLTPLPSALLKDSRALVIPTKADKPGTYRFVAVASSKEGDQLRVDFSILIDGPPVPPDPFVQALKDSYSKETETDKAKQVATLSSLYKTALTTTLNDPSVKTVGDLFTDLKNASTTLLPADALPLVRKTISDRLAKSIGTTASTPLNKALIMSEFTDIANALGGLK